MSVQIESLCTEAGAARRSPSAWVRWISLLHSRMARTFVPWVLRHPRHLSKLVRLARSHVRAQKMRTHMQESGVRVPPFLILSVTSKCNLRCAGCYAGDVGTVTNAPARAGLSIDEWESVASEASALGVIGFIIAGGEPFLLPGLTKLLRAHPDRLFLVFTNGTAIRASDYAELRRCTNVIVVVSVEGDQVLTDLRRGRGVFEKALGALDRLRAAGVLTGISVTIGPGNVGFWTDAYNIENLMAHTGPLAFFIEQIPEHGCEQGGMLTTEQRKRFRDTVVRYRERRTGGAFIIHSPDDEEALGGCVSAGRGFTHVNPAGDVTACPVSALATHNVKAATLREALASPLFTMIRENGHLLETAGHPCGLSAHAAELESMAAGVGAYRTGMNESRAETAESLVSLG